MPENENSTQSQGTFVALGKAGLAQLTEPVALIQHYQRLRREPFQGASEEWLKTQLAANAAKIDEALATISWLRSRIDCWEITKADMKAELAEARYPEDSRRDNGCRDGIQAKAENKGAKATRPQSEETKG